MQNFFAFASMSYYAPFPRWMRTNSKMIMRIGVCCGTILLITAQVLFADISKAQDIRETRIEFECKHVSLKTALQKLQAKSGYNFFYMSSKVSAYTDISLAEETRTIQNTLELILMNTPFGFKQEGKNIILSEKSPEQLPRQPS